MLRLVAWSSRHPWVVISLAILLAIAGELARRGLSRDVIPDLSEPQIVIVADWMGHPAPEVATDVTQVLTRALDGIPGKVAVRGTSMSGMSYVDVVFAASVDLNAGQRAVAERVAATQTSLPETVRVQVGPPAASTGWVFEYAVVDPTHRQSMVELRHLQDDVLRPALASLPGVAEIAPVGGGIQQAVVEWRVDQMRERSVALSDVITTLRTALGNHPEISLEEIGELPIDAAPVGPDGRKTLVADVAAVRVVDDMPLGAADFGGRFQAVGGIVIARRDADPAAVAASARTKLEQLRPMLPDGVQILPVYDRHDLVGRVETTLLHAVGEEVCVVALVVLIFLLSWRSAIIPMLTLASVLLLTFGVMWVFHLPATLMSLGGIGIAIGIAVDADVVALEASHRRLEALPGDAAAEARGAAILTAAKSFAPAILISLLITALSFLPVFSFTGESGRLLRPFALTKTIVIGAAALVSLTLGPALRSRLLKGDVRPEFEHPLTRNLVRAYRPFVHFALSRPWLTLLTAAFTVVSCLPLLPRLGGEFLPRIDEGDLLFMPTTLPGVPQEQALNQLRFQDRTLGNFKEVASVFGKIGRAETATDPAPYSMVETTVRLRPRAEWPLQERTRFYSGWAPSFLRSFFNVLWPEHGPSTTAELIDRLDDASRLPGWTGAWTAPARARMDMMSTGVRTPLALRVVAKTPERLEALGAAARDGLSELKDTRSAVWESLGGETRLQFTPDAEALARLEVPASIARSTSDLLVTGGQIGDINHAGRRLRLRVRSNVKEMARAPSDDLRDATVRSPSSGEGPIALAMLGHPGFAPMPAVLRTESGELVGYVYVDLAEGVDVLGYVEHTQEQLREALAKVELRDGERTEWAGQYELLAAGSRRLVWIVPMVAALMLGLLFLQFRSLTEALIVLVAVPFALVGSVWALFLAHYPLSAPVWVGLLSVLGLAMQTGVVMVVYIDEAFFRRVRAGRLKSREDIVQAHAEGTIQRLRPKIMTIATMAAGLLPLLWSEGAGSEVMKRVAVPMIGGLTTSAFLTLEVLPVLYTIWRYRQLRQAERTGIPLEVVVGRAPPWARHD